MGAVPRPRFEAAEGGAQAAGRGRSAQHLPAGRDGRLRLHLRQRGPAAETGRVITRFDTPLPIDDVLAELASTLRKSNAAVLVAPPGAGKTTRVPLALLDEPWLSGKKIILLEPRRIAAR